MAGAETGAGTAVATPSALPARGAEVTDFAFASALLLSAGCGPVA